MNTIMTVCALFLAAGVSLVFAAEPAPKDLRLFYQSNCARCHGADGSARDAQGKSMKGQDFTEARWRADSSDASMVKVILKGKFFGLAMPGFRSQLTIEESQRFVTEIIRQAVKGKAIEPEPKAPEAVQP